MDEFVSYLTYEEYEELGGSLPLDDFTRLERKAQRWLDSFTFYRIPKLPEIPDVVKEVLTEYISRLNTVDNQRENGDLVTQYSNGVEQLTYKVVSENETESDLYDLAVNWLPDYLTYRGVNFDVEEYLQSNGDNP